MKKSILTRSLLVSIVCFLSVFASQASFAQDERSLHQSILKTIRKDIEENYYDPKYHGVDIDASFKKAAEFIKNAKSVEEMTDIITRFLYQFDDSHLFYMPPRSTTSVDYGWKIQMIGDKAFITDVKENSDAWAKGIRPGDRLYMLEGFIPDREGFRVLKAHYEFISPQPSLEAIVVKPSGQSYKVVIKAKVTKDNPFMPSRRELELDYERENAKYTHQSFYDEIPGLCMWKMPSFDVGEIKLDKMADKLKKCPSLILDLRSNGGGRVTALFQLISDFFDHDVTVGVAKQRDGDRSMAVKFEGQKPYTGKLAVLIDSQSASAAELFARVVQLEKRGTVVGDQSAGAVMEAQSIYHRFGLESVIPYGVSVTVADIIMRDGRRLEKVGVEPDEKVLPSPADLLNSRDPALARAAQVLGFILTPEAAGRIFPKEKDEQ